MQTINCDRELARSGEISSKITGTIIALPLITSSQWQQKGGASLTNYPTMIFQDQLTKHSLLKSIQQSLPLIPGVDLDESYPFIPESLPLSLQA
ncbi:MAG: hypothetical protein H0X31_19330 [Nostocaceae cyanobacterium]|nr:hypothetical protein [Nostocaceae cyanobacterium]